MADAPKALTITPALHEYALGHSTPLDDVQMALIHETRELGTISIMQIAPEQGALMTMLVRLLGAKQIVEVGTFTGYSALAMAKGLPPGGRILACDVSTEWTDIARRHWEMAGVSDRIDLRIAPALDTLRSLPAEATIDLAFVDADKGGYISYYEELIPRLRPGGLLLADNALMGGSVVDPLADHDNAVAMRAFNDHVVADDRVEVVLMPISDGLSFIRKR